MEEQLQTLYALAVGFAIVGAFCALLFALWTVAMILAHGSEAWSRIVAGLLCVIFWTVVLGVCFVVGSVVTN